VETWGYGRMDGEGGIVAGRDIIGSLSWWRRGSGKKKKKKKGTPSFGKKVN